MINRSAKFRIFRQAGADLVPPLASFIGFANAKLAVKNAGDQAEPGGPDRGSQKKRWRAQSAHGDKLRFQPGRFWAIVVALAGTSAEAELRA
jgi:hypothetical protein